MTSSLMRYDGSKERLLTMETISITLPKSKRIATVYLDRKKMKTCRLKVYPDQKIVMSLPHSVPNEWAKSFLTEKGGWIESSYSLLRKQSDMQQLQKSKTDTQSKCLVKI